MPLMKVTDELPFHTMHPEQQQEVAVQLLNSCGISIVQAVQLIARMINSTGCSNPELLFQTVCGAVQQNNQSVSFREAVVETLATKNHRRTRTLSEIRYITKRFMKKFPELKKKPVNMITPADCNKYLQKSFGTPRQRYKARVILRGVFTIACKRDWCGQNPVSKVDVPVLNENQIEALSLEETDRLLETAEKQEHLPCLPALGLMLYAGIRPNEVLRLTWKDIDLEEKVITLRPRHTKTGGARHVTILPVLEKILSEGRRDLDKKICPANWHRRWKTLRAEAGWSSSTVPWPQDCLRHTYASYHAKHFRDMTGLQWEMGHRCLHLLRTRYLNMTGITRETARKFWKCH